MMDASLIAQYVVIALAVVLSVGYVARRQFPQGVRKLRLACAVPMVRAGRPAWMRRIGRWLAPTPKGGPGDDCGGCNGCKS